ncbi:hook-length control protein FliK [Andreprevotia lacus DSM 23236]|jgi:hypothetical protein|uniref:Hook-length control protein FliK n=1 Tax=Andreprevotia lacus DSM 23236 TaxID=1121001 RepID=A0A1W1XIY4_9NEIS|nr:flagellar hook-length control protein FliK [Andreprevotia lacus]SMC23468.1 hook-length control protein FliK [Andreprevotia lacus DSM 23236]
MLPGNTAISILQQYLKVQEGLFDVIRPAESGELRFTVGERVQATVTGQLPGGRFAVLVKDQLLDLNLPRNTEPGEKLVLDVVADQPKLTFALVERQPPAAQQQNNAHPTAAGAPQPEQAALSKGAQFLSTVLGGKDEATASLQLTQAEALFEGTPDPAQIASRLQQKVAESGLFYESHQVEWAGGQRPLQALLREPQNQPAQASAAQQPVANPAAADADTPLMTDRAQLQSAALSSLAVQGGDDRPPIQSLVQQQLNALEQKPLVWQGQAWPGQPMRWQLQTQDGGERDANSPDDAEAMRWQSRLDLHLPSLGNVSISTDLFQGRFSLRFQTDTPEAAQRLQAGQQQLGQQFVAAGLTLAAVPVFAVNGEPEPGTVNAEAAHGT